MTAGSSWIPEIDGLRFVAIALVVLFHLCGQVANKSLVRLVGQGWYGGLFEFLGRGGIGVYIFFVISGFILARPFARHLLLGEARPRLSSYYLRRLTRLEPPYLLNLAGCAIAIALYAREPLAALLPSLGASALYLHAFFFGSANPVSPVAWTLEMEVQFYLLMPLLATVFRIRPAWLRRSILLGACLALQLWIWSSAAASFPPGSRFWASVVWVLQYFLAGILLADLYVAGMDGWPGRRRWDLISGGAWVLLLLWPSRPVAALEPLVIAVAFLGAFRGALLRRVLSVPWITLLGGMCYSIYLWHFFILALVFKATRHLVLSRDLLANYLLQCVLILPAILAFSLVYYVLIERPCMDPAWPGQLGARLRAAWRRRREWPARESQAGGWESQTGGREEQTGGRGTTHPEPGSPAASLGPVAASLQGPA